MKKLEELEGLLYDEIYSFAEERIVPNERYLNQYLGDTSVLVTSILEEWLLERSDWDVKKWIDDALLTKIDIVDDTVSLWGVVILGREDTMKQWTDPFYFEGVMDESGNGFTKYTFLFGDEGEDIAYEEFNNSRDMWDEGFYSDKTWKPSERNWQYIINNKLNVGIKKQSSPEGNPSCAC